MTYPLAACIGAGAALLCLLAPAQAQTATASPTSVQLNGSVRLTANQVKSPTLSRVELRDNASRFGLKGTEDLGNGMKALFGLETGFAADTGAQSDADALFRHTYVGLGGGFGTLALGRLDSGNPTGSPLYSQVLGTISLAANDAGATSIGTSVLNARNRVDNAIGYSSPKWNGLDLKARLYLRGGTTATPAEDDAKSLDLGLNYAQGPLKAVLGWGKDKRAGGLANGEFDHKWQAGVRYDLGLVEPYLLLGRDTYRNTAVQTRQRDYWLVGAKLEVGNHAVVLNVMQRDTVALRGKLKREQVAYLYKLSKRTELQAFVDHSDANARLANQTTRAIGAGLRHDF